MGAVLKLFGPNPLAQSASFILILEQSQIKLQNGHKNSWSNTKTPAIYYVQLFALHGNNNLLVKLS